LKKFISAALQNPHVGIGSAAGDETPPEKITGKGTAKRSKKAAEKFFCAMSLGKSHGRIPGRIPGRTEKPHGNHLKDETIEEGFQPPQNKERNKTEIIRQETQAAGEDPDRNCEEGYKAGKVTPPKENTRIGRFPNAAPSKR
jgi:hypothetical protein